MNSRASGALLVLSNEYLAVGVKHSWTSRSPGLKTIAVCIYANLCLLVGKFCRVA